MAASERCMTDQDVFGVARTRQGSATVFTVRHYQTPWSTRVCCTATAVLDDADRQRVGAEPLLVEADVLHQASQQIEEQHRERQRGMVKP